LGDEDRAGEGSVGGRTKNAGGKAGSLPDSPDTPLDFPHQTPLFHAQHAERYARQLLIREYENRFNCRLVVLIDVIFPDTITLLEELIFDAKPDEDLHLLLDTPGGDGETAVRLARSAQARCHELTVIVPNQAKSAGTILVLGAHHILMGPTSDLGPVDPQFQHDKGLYSAKDLIAAVEKAEAAIAANPAVYPLHAALLGDFSAVMVQQARSAIGRSEHLVREALSSNPSRQEEDVERVTLALKERLIDWPLDHGAVFSAADAEKVGLPVKHADPTGEQWRLIWRLWTKYYALESFVAEGALASQVVPRGPYG
jgi:hypothetical protein